MEPKCETCENSIFDPVWGEHKCKIKGHRIYWPDDVVDCPDYKKKKPNEE